MSSDYDNPIRPVEIMMINNEINMQTKEVLELEAPDIRSANAWRKAILNAIK